MPRASAFRKPWLLALVSIALSVLFAEGAARVLRSTAIKQPRMAVYEGVRTQWAPENILVASDDGRIHFRPLAEFQLCYDGPGPGDLGPDGCVSHEMSSWGYRDVEHDWAKPPDTFRILVLGDSFTFGEGTPFEETYPRRLAAELASKSIEGRTVEVITMAMPGDGTLDQLAVYDAVQARLDPDLVLVQWNTNDFPVDSISRDHLKLIGVEYARLYDDTEVKWSALAHLVRHTLERNEIASQLAHTTNRDLEQGRENFDQLRTFFLGSTLVDGRQFALLIFPELVSFDDYPYRRIVDALGQFCAELEMPCINLLPALSEYRAEELWVHETDHHPNHVAHDVAVTEILRYLETEPSGKLRPSEKGARPELSP